MKIVNCDSLYDLLEDRRSRYRKSVKTNFCKRKCVRIYIKRSQNTKNGIT